jgi:hypothetical protein
MVKNTWLQCRRPLLGTALSVVLGALVSGGVARAASCPPWPGEPVPRPTRDDPDPLRARWAELHIADLARRAQALETAAPVEAHLLWRRLLCLGEGGDEARRGAERNRLVQIHHFGSVAAGDARAQSRDDLFASLEQPEAPAPKPRPPKDPRALRERLLRAVDHRLERTEDLLVDARFDAALESVVETRRRLKQIRRQQDVNDRWVHLEVLEATIQVARGEQDAAYACAVRALKVDPDLTLDPERISPKVVEVFEAAAEEGEAP